MASYTTCILCDDTFKNCLGFDTRALNANVNNNTSIISTASTYNLSSARSTFNTTQTSRPNATISNFAQQSRNNTQLPVAYVVPFRNVTNVNQMLANDDSNPTVCNCGKPAQLLTVRKEGPNQGRQFYKCGDNACTFFLFSDSAPVSADTSSNSGTGFRSYGSSDSRASNNSSRPNYANKNSNNRNTDTSGIDNLKCDCSIDAIW